MPRPRSLKINEKYFESIKTEEQAYILGFLYADGYNSVKRGRFVIALKAEDKLILERMRDCMEADHIIRIRTYARNDGYSAHTDGMKTMAYFEVNSRKMSNDLVSYGCGQGKSDRIRFPRQLPQNLWRHFLRGFFDGDGCISKKAMGRHVAFIATIISNPAFIEDIKSILDKKFETSFFVAKKMTKTHTLMVGGNVKAKKLLDWMYEGATISLDRKMALYQELVARCAKPRLTVTKRVGLFDVLKGSLVREFSSIKEAAKWLGLSPNSVSSAFCGNNSTVGGYLVKPI